MLRKFRIVMLVMLLCISTFCVRVGANTVEFRGEAEGLIATPDDFFLDIADLLPGDTKEDVAYIKNTTDDSVEIFFKTEPLDKSEYFDDIDYSLLEKINLRITLKKSGESTETEIYNGNLGAESLSEYISLGNYTKGFDGEFRFELDVPTSLKNEYTLSNTKVKWVFMVEKKDKETPDSNRVKTGDNIILAIIAFLIVVVIAIIVIILKKKSSKDDENEKKN